MTKNSLKTGPDELGYYGEGDAAMGGMAVGETLMPALHELSKDLKKLQKIRNFQMNMLITVNTTLVDLRHYTMQKILPKNQVEQKFYLNKNI